MSYSEPKKIKQPTDKDLLISMLLNAILETEAVLGHTPTRNDVLDHLFSEARDDPEARDLERRLAPALTRVLADWHPMDEIEEDPTESRPD